jgi:hypothetical protein
MWYFQIVPYTDEVVVNSLDCFQVNGTSDMKVRSTPAEQFL